MICNLVCRSLGVFGDFNEIIFQDEKKGGKQRDEKQMELFREVLMENFLDDVGCRGEWFTQSNNHFDDIFTKERLDRFVANPMWFSCFKGAEVEVLTGRCSDHRPLQLCWKASLHLSRRKQFLFRFEASWVKEEVCESLIAEEWGKGGVLTDPLWKVHKLLKGCSGSLLDWARYRKRNRLKEIKKLQTDEGPYNSERIKQLQKEVGTLLEIEDLKWRQRAKCNWYKLEDNNTKFFHACVSQRKKKIALSLCWILN